MEAVPKIPLINFESKVSPENTHFGPKLKQYIAEAYREDPDSYSNEVHQLEGLRSAAIRSSSDAAGLSALIKYFCQLRAMQSRFPMSKGAPAACSFTWKDLYAGVNSTVVDIRYEMACVLYNIGALNTQLGASEPRNTADSLKAACTHFQNAAWAFQSVKDQYPQPPGSDLATDVMRLLQEICLAQAQECVLDKSIQDTRKASVVGAVATQVSYFYKNSLALLGPSGGSDTIHEIIGTRLYNYWHRNLSFKFYYIGSIVCLYQGINAEEQQKMGERVAFYQIAVDRLNEARKLAKHVEPMQITLEALTFTNDVVEGKRKAAKNENEFIYHEKVPEKELLMELKPVCLVKALPINCNDPEVSGPDIFSRLVPMGAHEASSLYSEEKAKLLRHIVGQVEAKNMELTEFMSSLQLDQLDVLNSEQKIPQEIVDRCAAMNSKPEVIQTLMDSMNNLAEIITDVEHSLEEIKEFIQQETIKEKEYQKVMGPRPPSIVQTELSREYQKYLETHTRTNESNQVLHKAMTHHIGNLKLLALTLDALQHKIPSIENIEDLDRDTMKEMSRVVGKAREMQTQRDSLMQQLREEVTNDDITAILLAGGSDTTEDVFKRELEKHTPKVNIIEQNLAAQEKILNKLTSLYASYGESRRLLTDVLRKREVLISGLITSYDLHEELLAKSQKGLDFYKKLTHNVNQLLTRLRSICQVQEEERQQLLSKHSSKVSTPALPAVSKAVENIPSVVSDKPKLKDYLPYMKNRGMARSVTPQAQPVEPMSADSYYPESIYPTSVRPAPVGSEATDVSRLPLTDGIATPPMMQNQTTPNTQNPYNRYAAPYNQNVNPYSAPNEHNFPTSTKAYEKPSEDVNYPYSSAYNPSITSQMAQQPPQQSFTSLYYPGSSMDHTTPTDAHNPSYHNVQQANIPNTSQYTYSDPYSVQSSVPHVSEAGSTYNTNQNELNASFTQMHITVPKSVPNSSITQDYSHTYYNTQYPQTTTPNLASYANPISSSDTNVPSLTPSEYIGYNQYGQQNINTNAYNVSDKQYPYTVSSAVANVSQEYPIYTNADTSNNYSTTSTMPGSGITNMGLQYTYPNDQGKPVDPIELARLDAMDKPIKSHVTGEALSSTVGYPSYQSFDSHAYNSNEQNMQPQNMQAPSMQPQNSSSQDVYFQNVHSQNMTVHDGYSNDMQPQIMHSHDVQSLNMQPQNVTAHGMHSQDMQPQDIQSQNMQPQTIQNQNVQLPNIEKQNNQPQHIQSEIGQQIQSQNIDSTTDYNYGNQSNINYVQTYQSHPGYSFNPGTGNYDYNYGTQNAYTNYRNMSQANAAQPLAKDQNWAAHGVYTSAGICNTVQSPSEMPQPQSADEQVNQTYYNSPYGYVTNVIQPNDGVPNSTPASTNYGANINQSTYMQSGQGQDTSVTFTSTNQVAAAVENAINHSNSQSNNIDNTSNNERLSEQVDTKTNNSLSENDESRQISEAKDEKVPVLKTETTTFDLLSDIDFTVEVKTLLPEIKVPQISESVIRRPTIVQKIEPVIKPVVKEVVIERPAKRDLFSDPSLVNKFTQEVKNLQRLVDTLTNKLGGLTVLDTKWKTYQEVQANEYASRTKSVAAKHCKGNIVTEVVPYDDSRLTLKSDTDAFINASYYKQLAPWCIPLVIGGKPKEREYSTFWRAIIEHKITCIVCLLSEIEVQGSTYWPTAKGQTLELSGGLTVTLDEVACTVHWTERKLTVVCGKTALSVTHLQINVFPAKIVCSPLVLLADKILCQTYANRLSNQLVGACIQCSTGAGRSSVLALVIMTMCQVRAGQLNLCDMLDEGCVNLYKHRTNVLEDTKYLADAYRTSLFYVQGVLCSGTIMFNGESVCVQAGTSVVPPITPSASTNIASATSNPKVQKFSRESFEEMRQSPGLKSGDMKDPLNFLDPLWSLKKK